MRVHDPHPDAQLPLYQLDRLLQIRIVRDHNSRLAVLPEGVEQQVGRQSLLAIVIAIITALMVVVYLARDLLLIVGTVIAPLALASYSLPPLAELSSLWCRAYVTALFVQVAQAVLLSVGLQVAGHAGTLGVPASGLLDGLMLVTLLYLSLRLPFAAYHWAFGHGVTANRAVQTAIAVARTAWGAF